MGDTGATTYGGSASSGLDKGKGKVVDNHPADDVSMGEDEESSSDESVAEDVLVDEDEDESAQDNLEPISAANIISDGRRTRGKTIDFAEAAIKAQQAGEQIDEDDDDDDGDFEAHDDINNKNNHNHDDDDDMMKD